MSDLSQPLHDLVRHAYLLGYEHGREDRLSDAMPGHAGFALTGWGLALCMALLFLAQRAGAL